MDMTLNFRPVHTTLGHFIPTSFPDCHQLYAL